jgi:CRISPR-associated endonuclease/helicase Cas3
MTHAKILEKHFKFKPYEYQLRVAQALLEGKNVILRAPTGSGKTEAALAPFVIAKETQHATFPLKTMLASPMKTLAKSIHARAEKVTKQLGLDVRLHTGEDQGAPLLEGDVVVTTIDQLISNYAHIPLSMSNGRANIGAGAVISSYIVFDEFHLLDPKRAFQTALLMIEQLRDIVPFLLMTATLSSEMIAELEKVCQAVVIEPTTEELTQMPSQQKTRGFTREHGALTAENVVLHHQSRSLVILNTVARAQAMAADLTALQLPNTRIELIHSQFMPSDRAAKEVQLETWMGEKSFENIILVATQAIEVGINISSEHLHTELCPANSLLQRAGRCARFKGETGMVHVYDLPPDDTGKKRILPYKELVVELEATWAALENIVNPVDSSGEAKLINDVHTKRDLVYFNQAITNQGQHRVKLCDAQRLGDRSQTPHLIRQIVNQTVILHRLPEELTSWYEISKYQLCSLSQYKLGEAFETGTDGEGWTIKILREDQESQNDKRKVLTWYVPKHPNEVHKAPFVALNPDRIYYSPDSGLRPSVFQKSIGEFPREKEDKTHLVGDKEDFWYIFETYREHIEKVMKSSRQAERVPEIFGVAQKFERRFELPSKALVLAIDTAIAVHDVGKLAKGWQHWSREWQKAQCERYPTVLWDSVIAKLTCAPTIQANEMFSAHTDFHPKTKEYPSIDDFEREKNFHLKRPGHAGQSAWVFIRAFGKQFIQNFANQKQGTEMLNGIFWAIARHHGAYNKGEVIAWELDIGAAQEIIDVCKSFGIQSDEIALQNLEKNGVDASQPEKITLKPENLLGWFTYSLVSRALRIADQKSFDRKAILEQEA